MKEHMENCRREQVTNQDWGTVDVHVKTGS